jgi:hypothetical protein
VKRSVREKRFKLLNESKLLQEALFDTEPDKMKEAKKKQDDVYKKWKFYNNIIKEIEKKN